MELTSDLLLEAKFAPARRGYDMAEVDDFLERCAEGIDVLLDRLKSEYERAEVAEAKVAELEAQLLAMDDGHGEAPRPQERATPPPEPEPEPAPQVAPELSRSPVDVDEPMRVLVMAERTAEATVSEAREEADRIRREADEVATSQRSEAERLLTTARDEAEAEARRAGETARREVETEVQELRRNREDLTADIRNLQRWLDEQRGRMRTTARELQRLIDDPTALREFPTPSVDDAGEAPATDEWDGDVDDVGDDGSVPGAPTEAVPTVSFGDDEPDDVGDPSADETRW